VPSNPDLPALAARNFQTSCGQCNFALHILNHYHLRAGDTAASQTMVPKREGSSVTKEGSKRAKTTGSEDLVGD
jgi:hypothetical protein